MKADQSNRLPNLIGLDEPETDAAADFAKEYGHDEPLEDSPLYQGFIAGCEWQRKRKVTP